MILVHYRLVFTVERVKKRNVSLRLASLLRIQDNNLLVAWSDISPYMQPAGKASSGNLIATKH